MDSHLFGSGVPKFVVGEDEINIEKSFIESIEIGSRVIEHESIINTTRSWTNKSNYDHLTIVILIRLHKHLTNALTEFKTDLYAYNKTEVDAFYPSQNSDAFADKDGAIVKFFFEINEIFPLETPWAYDTMRVTFKSKKPVNLNALAVFTDAVAPSDTDGSIPTDTDGVIPTD